MGFRHSSNDEGVSSRLPAFLERPLAGIVVGMLWAISLPFQPIIRRHWRKA